MEEGKNFVVKLGLVCEDEQDEDAWTAIEFPDMGTSGLIVINNREELGQIWMDLTTGSRDLDPEFQGPTGPRSSRWCCATSPAPSW